MSTQYSNKNPGHQRNSKKEDINRKKGDDPKSEDKDNNDTGTAGTHLGDVITPEDSTAVGLVLVLMSQKSLNSHLGQHGL